MPSRKKDPEAATSEDTIPAEKKSQETQSSAEVSEQPAEWEGFIWGQMKTVLFSGWLNVLLIFVVLAWVAAELGAPSWVLFTFSIIGLVPLAERLSYATEQLALYTTPTIGGLLNASFGNISELVFVSISIVQGLNRLAQLFLLGSILGNLLLVLGMSFFLGGLRYPMQRFNKQGTVANMAILLLGTLAIVIPALINITDTQVHPGTVDELLISRIVSVALVGLYFAYLYFQLVSHAHLFEAIEGEEVEEGEHDIPRLGFWGSIFWLSVFAGLITVLSDYIVETLAKAAEVLGLPLGFITVILLPIVGNAAEHSSAIIFAYRNELPITLGICVGSATQIMVLMIPLAVIIAWIANQSLSLDFEPFETGVVFATVISTALTIQDGRSNWLKGLTLMTVYFVLGVGFWFHEVNLTAAA